VKFFSACLSCAGHKISSGRSGENSRLTEAEVLRRDFGRPSASPWMKKAEYAGALSGRDTGASAADSAGRKSPAPKDQVIDCKRYFGAKKFSRCEPAPAGSFDGPGAMIRRLLPHARSGSFRRPQKPLALLICVARVAAVPGLRALAAPDAAAKLIRGAKPNRRPVREGRPFCRQALSRTTAPAISLSRRLL
jgi:hypothetical protein